MGVIGSDNLFGGQGDDTLIAGNDSAGNYLAGDEGNDSLTGSTGNDTLEGGAGNDTSVGGAGDDEINDSEGSNSIDAGAGNDRITVYSTNPGESSTITGGAGSDTYVLSPDGVTGHEIIITDFAAGAGGDILDIDALLTNSTGYSGGNPFGTQGYLKLVTEGNDTLLKWDSDGAGGANGLQTLARLQGVAKADADRRKFHAHGSTRWQFAGHYDHRHRKQRYAAR